MAQSVRFDVLHNDAFLALGALAPVQQWSAFDVPRAEARAGKASIFVTTIWNIHSTRDEHGSRVPTDLAIAQDIVDGTLWYHITRPGEGDRKTWVAHWNGLELAFSLRVPVVGVLKDVASGRCSMESVFDCPGRLYEPGEEAMWLQLVPRREIGCEVRPIDIHEVTGVARVRPTSDDLQRDFERRVREASRSTSEARRARLEAAPRVPRRVTASATVFIRNADVGAEVLMRANGHCEGCGNPAPFLRKADGTPYLEVHHRIQLSQGGEDTVENATALCPNCHRELHFGLR